MREQVRYLGITGALITSFVALDHPMVAAQDAVMVGERVRADLLGAERVEGVVLDWGGQALSLQIDPDSVWTSEWVDVAGAEWLRTHRRTARGLGLGVLIGGVGTGLVAAIAIEPCQGTGFCVGPDSRMEGGLVFGLVGAALGGAVGLIVGTLVQSSSWEPLAIPGRASSTSLGLRWRVSTSDAFRAQRQADGRRDWRDGGLFGVQMTRR
jgi:hypothetical protein